MSIIRSITIAAAAALLAVPSAALAVGPPSNPGGDHRPAGTPASPASPSTQAGVAQPTSDTARPTATSEPPGPDAPAGSKAKAYGKYCQGESKKHVKGKKGTPFSRCVTAMAKVATGEETSARAACARLSRKHKAGRRGTPFSRCVAAARKLSDESAGA